MVIFPHSVVVREAAVPASHDVEGGQVPPAEVHGTEQLVPDVAAERGVLALRDLAAHPAEEVLEGAPGDGALGVPPAGAQPQRRGAVRGRLEVTLAVPGGWMLDVSNVWE